MPFQIRMVLAVSLLCAACLAQAAENRFFEVWQCSLKDGASMEQVSAANAKWLKFVNQVVPEGRITSGTVAAVVGDYTHFSIIDSYPDELAWAKVKVTLKTPAGEAAGGDLDNVLHCTDNTLQSYTPSE
jgi:hypothetical protein